MLPTKVDGGFVHGLVSSKLGYSIFFIISFFLVRIIDLWFGKTGSALLMITSMYINGNVAYFDKIMLRKKKIIVTKDRMMQMNVNQHSKPSNSKLAALTMTELVKVPESQNTETTLQIAQEAENHNMKTNK